MTIKILLGEKRKFTNGKIAMATGADSLRLFWRCEHRNCIRTGWYSISRWVKLELIEKGTVEVIVYKVIKKPK